MRKRKRLRVVSERISTANSVANSAPNSNRSILEVSTQVMSADAYPIPHVRVELDNVMNLLLNILLAS